MGDRRSSINAARLRLLLATAGLAGLLTRAAPADDEPVPGPPPIDALRDRILAGAALRPGMTVAEIGLGRGWFVFRAAKAVGPDGTVYATDIDPEAIASMRKQLPNINPAAGRVDLRLCKDPRDTALDDLPEGRVDVVLMIDSLCFAAGERAQNADYLRRFLRILRPGGRLIHHMDCQCDVEPADVVQQFTEAGFSPAVDLVQVPSEAELTDASESCRSEAARRRHGFVPVFRKPGPATR